MEFTELTVENRREMLRNEIRNLESQLYGRERDVRHWRAFLEMDLGEAAVVDSRILNNQKDEGKQQLAGALFDCAKAELKLRQTKEELDSLGKA